MDQPAPWRVLEERPDGVPQASATNASPAVPGRLIAIAGIGITGALAVAAFVVAASSSAPAVDVVGGVPVSAGGSVSSLGPNATGDVLVDVQGAVARPGVVRLASGSRVGDAITAAGGYGPRVAADRIGQALNLAAVVRDGDHIQVPSRDDPPTGGGAVTGSAGGAVASGGPSSPIDLNRATAAELDQLPGIGPVTATKIITARDEQPFASVDDLRARKLVGPATFEKLKDFVVVR